MSGYRTSTTLTDPIDSYKNVAQKIGISVNTLKSWEQGVRNPSGVALKLIQLLDKRPELILELGA